MDVKQAGEGSGQIGEGLANEERATAVARRDEAGAVERRDTYAQTPEEFGVALREEGGKRRMLLDYVRAHLVPGVDYQLIHTKIGPKGSKQYCPKSRVKFLVDAQNNPLPCKDCGAKPTLAKSGAEKMCSLLHVTPSFSLDGETMEALALRGRGVAYRCHLVSLHTGSIQAEGRGAGMLDEQYPDPNKTIKMAQKSAQTDAVLRLCGLSVLMTQDLDTMPNETSPAEPTRQEQHDALAEEIAGAFNGQAEKGGADAETGADIPNVAPPASTAPLNLGNFPIPPCPENPKHGQMKDTRAFRLADQEEIRGGTRKLNAKGQPVAPRPCCHCDVEGCDGKIWSTRKAFIQARILQAKRDDDMGWLHKLNDKMVELGLKDPGKWLTAKIDDAVLDDLVRWVIG